MSNEFAERADVVPRNEQPDAPIEELATAGPVLDVSASVQAAVVTLDAKPKHGNDGRFVKDTPAGLVTGTRSQQLKNALEPARRSIVAQVMSDLGVESDALPATLTRLVGAFSETTLLRESVFLRMAGQPTTNKGKARAMLSAYLQLVDRELRLAMAIGLERRARHVDTLEAAIAREPEAR